MQTRLGEINVRLVDTIVGSVRLHNPAHLNRDGQRLVRDVGRKVKGISDVIVTDEFIILDCNDCTEEGKLKKLAHSYMLALESKLIELDEDQFSEMIGVYDIQSAMAAHSVGGIFHSQES